MSRCAHKATPRNGIQEYVGTAYELCINYEGEEEKTTPRLMPVRGSKLVTWKDTKHQSLQAPQECVGLNRQKHLPRPTTDRWHGIARIQRRVKVPKTEVRSKQ